MRARTLVVSFLAAAGLVTAALAVASPFARAADDGRDFDGWLVVQDATEERFPESDGWRASPFRDGFQLQRISETVSFYGTFRVERHQSVQTDYGRQTKTDPGDGWTVRQAGEVRSYPRTEGWVGRGNPDGYYLERRGQTVWYYGTFRATEHPKDDSGQRTRR